MRLARHSIVRMESLPYEHVIALPHLRAVNKFGGG